MNQSCRVSFRTGGWRAKEPKRITAQRPEILSCKNRLRPSASSGARTSVRILPHAASLDAFGREEYRAHHVCSTADCPRPPAHGVQQRGRSSEHRNADRREQRRRRRRRSHAPDEARHRHSHGPPPRHLGASPRGRRVLGHDRWPPARAWARRRVDRDPLARTCESDAVPGGERPSTDRARPGLRRLDRRGRARDNGQRTLRERGGILASHRGWHRAA